MRPLPTARNLPANRKKPGLSYIRSREGIELPVIDLSHPAFQLRLEAGEIESLTSRSIQDVDRQGRGPVFLRKIILRLMLKDSILAKGITASRGGYLDGMGTYLLKLGPENLDESYANAVDRKIAASLPCLSVRLRLRATATLLAQGALGALEASRDRALHFVNLAGGPASDSHNALIALQKREPRLLSGRKIRLSILDLDESGPEFGAAALEALRAEGGPLEGLAPSWRHYRYDWSREGMLAEILTGLGLEGEIVAGSSEGGLFEYASDEELVAALRDFASLTDDDARFTGSLSRIDGSASRLNGAGGAAIRLRSPEAFAALLCDAGWEIAETIDCPLCRVVHLRKK